MIGAGVGERASEPEKGIRLGGLDLGVTTMVGESPSSDEEISALMRTPSELLLLLCASTTTMGLSAGEGIAVDGSGVEEEGAGMDGTNCGLHMLCAKWFGLGEGTSRKADMPPPCCCCCCCCCWCFNWCCNWCWRSPVPRSILRLLLAATNGKGLLLRRTWGGGGGEGDGLTITLFLLRVLSSLW